MPRTAGHFLMLKVLYLPFMFFGLLHRVKSSQVPSLSSLWINFAGIDPELPRFKFAYHISSFTASLKK